MDPLTQGVLGGLVAQAGSRPQLLARACITGALAGMAPDLDVLIRSDSDPLLALEYHRHFTHSLFFIPFGALLCALIIYPLQARRWGCSFGRIYLWALLGYGSHGLLDACTSYGTQLLWPFSNQRFAWDTISVIDPLFSLPLLLLLLYACRRGRKTPVYAALGWGALYLALGLVQQQRALNMGWAVALERGHQPQQLEAKPSFGNLMVWKIIYTTDSHFYVDAVKPGLSSSHHWSGDRVARLEPKRDLPWLVPNSAQARDLQRFAWFSAGYIALDRNNPLQIVDIRYSMLPHQIAPLWGIRMSPQAGATQPAQYYAQRADSSAALPLLIEMLLH